MAEIARETATRRRAGTYSRTISQTYFAAVAAFVSSGLLNFAIRSDTIVRAAILQRDHIGNALPSGKLATERHQYCILHFTEAGKNVFEYCCDGKPSVACKAVEASCETVEAICG